MKILFLFFFYFISHLYSNPTKDFNSLYESLLKDEKNKVIIKYPEGIVNWEDGIISTYVNSAYDLPLKDQINIFSSLKGNFYDAYLLIEELLLKKAKDNLLKVIFRIFLEEDTSLKDFYEKLKHPSKLINNIVQNIVSYPTIHFKDNHFQKRLDFSLYGQNSLSHIVMNEDFYIRDNIQSTTIKNSKDEYDEMENSFEQKSFSSLIIDLRKEYLFKNLTSQHIKLPKSFSIPRQIKQKVSYNFSTSHIFIHSKLSLDEQKILLNIRPKDPYYHFIIQKMIHSIKKKPNRFKFNPSLFPEIYTDSNSLLYSRHHIPINLRSEKIIFAKYINKIETFYDFEKVGKNPFFIIASYVKGKNHSNIILNKKLATPFFSNKKNIQKLYEGKLFLLIN